MNTVSASSWCDPGTVRIVFVRSGGDEAVSVEAEVTVFFEVDPHSTVFCVVGAETD